jgi:hypothetical protein
MTGQVITIWEESTLHRILKEKLLGSGHFGD